MSGELGKASLELDVTGFVQFESKITEAGTVADRLEDKLKGVAAVADVTGHLLGHVEISQAQAARSVGSAAAILEGVHGIGDEAREAARNIDDVHLSGTEAAETEVAGETIISVLKDINRNANETNRSLDRVALKSKAVRTTGAGVGPFGSGFGRVGLLGTAIGVGALTAPAAAPAAAGLLAGIPTLGAAAVGVIGTVVLALKGMGKAIDGDFKAYQQLEPEQKQFVQTVRSLIPWVDKLKQTAAGGLVPGLTAGLQAALSPGTVSLIERSVTMISTTLGQATANLGAYFGSAEFQSIFGPLMVSGARNLGVLAAAALNLFDALGILGRAGIPLVNWITDAIARGSQLADEWLHAKDASGELAHGMDEAQSSLRLVGGLILAAVRAVGALGIALYPVSKVAVKDLTDGLNALAGIIHNNEGAIRSIVGTGLTGLVTIVQIAAGAIGLFNDALTQIVGNKAAVVTAIAVIGAVIALTLGPEAAVIAGVILAVGLIKDHWSGIVDFFKTLMVEIENVFGYAWAQLERGAIFAALKVVEPFSHLPAFLGGWARDAKTALEQELDSIKPPNLDWSTAALQAGVNTGQAWMKGFDQVQQHGGVLLRKSGLYVPPPDTTKKANEPAPGTHAWYLKYLGYDPTAKPDTSVFSTPPPFTKNVPAVQQPKGLEIPLNLQLRQAEADASGVESKQKAVARAIKRWAERMVASGKLTTKQLIDGYQLIAQENSVLGTQQNDQLSVPLKLQLQQARADASGVESKQRAAAIAIRNWAKRMVHSGKLTTQQLIDAYDLIAQENSALANKVNAVSPGANEKQFLSSFQALLGSFGSNSEPAQPNTGRSESHLYELVHETRAQTGLLKGVTRRLTFPMSGYAVGSAEAAMG